MQLHEFADERQADAAALMAASTRVLDAMKALEHPRQLFGRNARARVAHRQLDGAAGIVDAHRDLAFEGELERVRQQVENDLLPHLVIDVDRIGQRRAIDDEADAGALARRTEVAREIDGQRAQVSRLIGRLRAARLDAREVEQRVDEPEQAHAVALRNRQQSTIVRRQAFGLREQVFERPEHQRQRRTELVTDVAEERRLRAIQLGELFGTLPLVFQRAHAGERPRNVGAGQPHEVAIVVVELAPRAQSANQVAVGFVGARG